MWERIHAPESTAPIQLGPNTFKQFEEFAETIQDPRRKQIIQNTIEEGKRHAFEYTEEVLNHLGESDSVAPHTPPAAKDATSFNVESPSHSVMSSMAALFLSAQNMGREVELPKGDLARMNAMGIAALEYVKKTLEDYQDAIAHAAKPEDIMSHLDLPKNVTLEYLKTHLLDKIERLSPELRKQIFNRI